MRIAPQRLAALSAVLLCLLVFASSSQEVDENNATDKSQQRLEEKKKGPWGGSPGAAEKESNASSSDATTANNSNSNNNKHSSGSNPSTTIPFVPKTTSSSSHTIPRQYEPPQGFRITSRVYTDPDDKLAHFDNDISIVFPYWECGVAGSTTSPIPLQHATVRHLLGGSKPNLYSGEEFGPHPQLVIALTSLEVILNSGQVQTFAPGDVILLEDVLSGGHKLKGHDQHDMTVMILTLPQHYHQVGKDKSSLQNNISVKQTTNDPCPTGWKQFSSDTGDSFPQKLGQALKRFQPRSIRRYVLTFIGLAISTVLGDFMGKVAPLWLAVVFGGGCFVTGGTYGFVKVGDYCLDELGTWQERQQLRSQDGEETTTTKEEEEKENPPIHHEFETKESGQKMA